MARGFLSFVVAAEVEAVAAVVVVGFLEGVLFPRPEEGLFVVCFRPLPLLQGYSTILSRYL